MAKTIGMCRALGRIVDRALGTNVIGVDVPEDPPAQELHVETDAPATEDIDTEDESFSGGPGDCSVLTEYTDHVTLRVWAEEERPELKLASHGRKVVKFGRPVAEIEGLVAVIGLSPLIGCSVETRDRGLLSTFVDQA